MVQTKLRRVCMKITTNRAPMVQTKLRGACMKITKNSAFMVQTKLKTMFAYIAGIQRADSSKQFFFYDFVT